MASLKRCNEQRFASMNLQPINVCVRGPYRRPAAAVLLLFFRRDAVDFGGLYVCADNRGIPRLPRRRPIASKRVRHPSESIRIRSRSFSRSSSSFSFHLIVSCRCTRWRYCGIMDKFAAALMTCCVLRAIQEGREEQPKRMSRNIHTENAGY